MEEIKLNDQELVRRAKANELRERVLIHMVLNMTARPLVSK